MTVLESEIILSDQPSNLLLEIYLRDYFVRSRKVQKKQNMPTVLLYTVS